MSQQELAQEIGTTQALISRIEKDGATTFSVKTLQRIADAFDVALVVRLEPIDRLLRYTDELSPSDLSPRPSSEILANMERNAAEGARRTAATQRTSLQLVTSTAGGIIQSSFAFDRPRPVEEIGAITQLVQEEAAEWQKIAISQ